eukprot:g4091.t1
MEISFKRIRVNEIHLFLDIGKICGNLGLKQTGILLRSLRILFARGQEITDVIQDEQEDIHIDDFQPLYRLFFILEDKELQRKDDSDGSDDDTDKGRTLPFEGRILPSPFSFSSVNASVFTSLQQIDYALNLKIPYTLLAWSNLLHQHRTMLPHLMTRGPLNLGCALVLGPAAEEGLDLIADILTRDVIAHHNRGNFFEQVFEGRKPQPLFNRLDYKWPDIFARHEIHRRQGGQGIIGLDTKQLKSTSTSQLKSTSTLQKNFPSILQKNFPSTLHKQFPSTLQNQFPSTLQKKIPSQKELSLHQHPLPRWTPWQPIAVLVISAAAALRVEEQVRFMRSLSKAERTKRSLSIALENLRIILEYALRVNTKYTLKSDNSNDPRKDHRSSKLQVIATIVLASREGSGYKTRLDTSNPLLEENKDNKNYEKEKRKSNSLVDAVSEEEKSFENCWLETHKRINGRDWKDVFPSDDSERALVRHTFLYTRLEHLRKRPSLITALAHNAALFHQN